MPTTRPQKSNEPRYHPDTIKHVIQTFTSLEERVGRAFKDRIALVKGRKR